MAKDGSDSSREAHELRNERKAFPLLRKEKLGRKLSCIQHKIETGFHLAKTRRCRCLTSL